MKRIKCGVIGATGMVGQIFLEHLSNHPWIEVTVVAASKKSAGQSILQRLAIDDVIKVLPEKIKDLKILDVWDIEAIAPQVDFVFCALDMPKDEIIKLEEAYAKAEIIVVSNNSAQRFIDDVPMIVPEINGLSHLKILKKQRERLGTKYGCIVVKPNCAAQAFMGILDAFDALKMGTITVSLIQAISGSGKHLKDVPEIHGNILPLPDEAKKSVKEPKKIFGKIKDGKIISNEDMEIVASSYRAGIEDGHTANISFTLKAKYGITKETLLEMLSTYNPLAELNLPSSPNPVINYIGDKQPNPLEHVNNQKGMEFTCGGLKFDEETGNIQITGLIHNLVRGAAGGAILTAELMIAKEIIQNRIA